METLIYAHNKDRVIWFGKYKGQKTFEQIKTDDFDYFMWLLQKKIIKLPQPTPVEKEVSE